MAFKNGCDRERIWPTLRPEFTLGDVKKYLSQITSWYSDRDLNSGHSRYEVGLLLAVDRMKIYFIASNTPSCIDIGTKLPFIFTKY
jgi:hypothetical protein